MAKNHALSSPRVAARPPRAAPAPEPAAIPDFDRLIHERMRLGIVSALTATGRKAFEKYLDHMEALIQAMGR